MPRLDARRHGTCSELQTRTYASRTSDYDCKGEGDGTVPAGRGDRACDSRHRPSAVGDVLRPAVPAGDDVCGCVRTAPIFIACAVRSDSTIDMWMSAQRARSQQGRSF
jgi:hypothetical protein